LFTQENPRTLPKKVRKIRKNPKDPTTFGGIYWAIQCLNRSFIYKILVHQKKNPKRSEKSKINFKNLKIFLRIQMCKNQKKSEKSEKSKKKSKKSKDFFEDLKSEHPIWEWTTPRVKGLDTQLNI
jgi:hypothetical protein